MAALRKVVVFGGNGFVGAEVLRALAAAPGVAAVGVARRAKPAWVSGDVDWKQADCLDPASYAEALRGAAAVVVSVGSPPLPGDFDEARRANGATNVSVLEAAAAAGVGRAVLVNATMPRWLDSVAGGYARGKRDAEAAAEAFAVEGRSAAVVKPTAVYGTRRTAGGLPVPLAPLLAPVSYGLRLAKPAAGWLAAAAPALFDGVLDPPVPVAALARTVADACFDEALAGCAVLGPDDILKNA
mmetsp:Transcript_24044/g.72131  ORF Transcript_24044/g.72131 Transcript_24044/m.72131 type:complete len:242 (+) Transcript_24044:86-811(+)